MGIFKFVSIIVLNFNGEKVIGKCLDALLNQTYPNFEIIIVDNNSYDRSLEIISDYLEIGNISVVKSKKNLGVAGGRNLGLLYAKGEIIAFIDNDGYAHKNWLAEAVKTLESDEKIGAVASVVFFSHKRIILNGAGGTLNFQGYGGDLCFNMPYEFAQIPKEVLYPMGCGMVVRKNVMDMIGPLDPTPLKWYDDAELGIRIWKSGFKVVVSPYAWVDHAFGYSDQFLKSKVYMCERARIRTILKYYSALQLFLWIPRELWYSLRYFLKSPSCWGIPLKSWLWNIYHLGSALKWRWKFISKRNSFWHLLHQSWGTFPPPTPNNQAFIPNFKSLGKDLILDGHSDLHYLNFGWYYPERDGAISYRWTEAQASAFLKISSEIHSMFIKLRAPQSKEQKIKVIFRRLGEINPESEVFVLANSDWQEKKYEVRLGEGFYELIISPETVVKGRCRRLLGVAVSYMRFI